MVGRQNTWADAGRPDCCSRARVVALSPTWASAAARLWAAVGSTAAPSAVAAISACRRRHSAACQASSSVPGGSTWRPADQAASQSGR